MADDWDDYFASALDLVHSEVSMTSARNKSTGDSIEELRADEKTMLLAAARFGDAGRF